MAKDSSARRSVRSAPVSSSKAKPSTAPVKLTSKPAAKHVVKDVSAGTPSRLPKVPLAKDVAREKAEKKAAAKGGTRAVESVAPPAAPVVPVAPVAASKSATPAAAAPAKSAARAKSTAASAASRASVVVETVPSPATPAPSSHRSEATLKAIAAASPRQTTPQPPARQLGLRATRPEEVANVRPLEMRSGRSTEARSPKSSTDINGYNAAVRYLMERTDFERMRSVRYNEQTFKLERMQQLLAKLGNPHEQIRTVHVAGTNGKGSTVAMIASMLQACGYTVGVYTSPHLVELRDRIVINGQSIDRAVFADAVKTVAKAAEKAGVDPTFFEVVTAVCFKFFAEQAVDIAVIEVGLGGRLDSTNVIRPEACVITSIDFDHMKLLGNTLEEIAREKAGIFKKDVPAFIFESEPSVQQAIAEVAERTGAPLRVVNKDIDYSARFCVTEDLGPHTRVCLYSKNSRLEHLPVPLPGEHQASNCGLALAVVDHLKTVGFDCPEDKITAGLAATKVPGRMQLVWDRPRVLVDGAHNPAAVGALMRCVGAHVPYDSMICVFGCCSDKDVPGLIDKVNLGADKVIFTRAAGNPRAADPEDLQKLFNERSGKMSQVAKSLPEALEMATRAVSREDLVCVTGSFYLVGETLKHLQHFDRAKGGKISAEIPE
jgi:dihydrofolate synthase/folylpolyglutamate synthase